MSGVPGWVAGVPAPRDATVPRFRRFRPLEKFGDLDGLRVAVAFWNVAGWYVGGGRGNWRNEANWWGKWLSFLGGSGYGAGSARRPGKRGALPVARCFVTLPRTRIPRVSDGPYGDRAWGVVTQYPEAEGISRVGISHFSAMGCRHRRRFCDAIRSITRAPSEKRRDLGLGAGF